MMELEILKAVAILMIAVPICIVLAFIIIGVPCILWIAIDEGIYYVKEKYFCK